MTAFRRLAQAAYDCLQEMGADADDVDLGAVALIPRDGGKPIEIPLFGRGAPLDATDKTILQVVRDAGEALQQKEIANLASLSLRTVQKRTPDLVKSGHLIHHPTLGFYLPGMQPAR